MCNYLASNQNNYITIPLHTYFMTAYKFVAEHIYTDLYAFKSNNGILTINVYKYILEWLNMQYHGGYVFTVDVRIPDVRFSDIFIYVRLIKRPVIG